MKDSDICIVTSFNQKLYEKYAFQFINSYNNQNIPFDLYIYSEDDSNDFKNLKSNMYLIQLLNVEKNLKKFYVNNENYNLEIYKNTPEKRKWKYDAIRFSYKVFSLTHNFFNFKKYNYMIWIDADTVFQKSFNNKLIKSLIKKDNMMSYLGRSKLEGHSECGFLIFNRLNEKTNNYLIDMKNMYLTKSVFNEKEWHDSYIWDLIRKKYEKKYNITNFNISEFFYNELINKEKINKDEFMSKNILLKIPLNKYLLHLKGSKNKEKKDIVTQKETNTYQYKINL